MKTALFFIKYLFAGMKIVEQILPPKTGVTKKEIVVEVAKLAIEALKTESTGGQKETWDKIAEPVSDLIDYASGIFFPKKA